MKLLKKVIIYTSLIAAMIGALSKPASADFLSKKDKITIGDMRKSNPNRYENFEAQTERLFGKFKELNKEFERLREKKFGDKADELDLNFIAHLLSDLRDLHQKIMPGFFALAKENNLELKAVFDAIEKLHKEYIKTIISFSDDLIRLFEKKDKLDENDIKIIHNLIDILESLHKRYNMADASLLNRLKILLAREINSKYP